MTDQCYLAVDLGAESGRVIAGRFDGRRIQLEQIRRFGNGPVAIGGTLRWDVLRLWSDILDGLTQAATECGGQASSIGVDTWGVDYVLMSAEDELLGQPYHYRDQRTRGLLAHATTQVSRSEIFAATGLQFMEINTLYQLLAAQQRTPRLLETASRFLMIPDFFHWCLSGSRVVEFTNATTTQCFDATANDWAIPMLQKLGIPTHLFPEVVPPGARLGRLRAEVADRTGLGRIDVIAPPTHDTASAVAAVPASHTGVPNWAYISSGTWSLMGVEVQQAVLQPRALELNVTNEGGVDGTYRLLKNIMGLWLVQECRRAFRDNGKPLDYAHLVQLAVDAPPFRSLIDPDDARFLSPASMPEAIAEYCRSHVQPVPETEGQYVRCALESLALKYRMVLGWLEELTGVPIETIHIVGGGTQNELLNQFTANACGRPVLAGPVEATAMGNVLMQARAQGELSSLAELRSVVRASSEMKEYVPADQDAWQQAYGRFESLTRSPGR